MRKHYLLILALFLPLLSWAEEDMAIFSELTYLSAAPGGTPSSQLCWRTMP